MPRPGSRRMGRTAARWSACSAVGHAAHAAAACPTGRPGLLACGGPARNCTPLQSQPQQELASATAEAKPRKQGVSMKKLQQW
jgi:hypothetical protein